jgi:hypothetical protein
MLEPLSEYSVNLAALINTSGDLLKAEKLNITSLRIFSKSL